LNGVFFTRTGVHLGSKNAYSLVKGGGNGDAKHKQKSRPLSGRFGPAAIRAALNAVSATATRRNCVLVPRRSAARGQRSRDGLRPPKIWKKLAAGPKSNRTWAVDMRHGPVGRKFCRGANVICASTGKPRTGPGTRFAGTSKTTASDGFVRSIPISPITRRRRKVLNCKGRMARPRQARSCSGNGEAFGGPAAYGGPAL